MNKLYLVSFNFNTMFLSTEENKKADADRFTKEEFGTNGLKPCLKTMEVREITSEQEIPLGWREGALLWGTEDEITAGGWLYEYSKVKNDPEYQDYLRLKSKFEKDA